MPRPNPDLDNSRPLRQTRSPHSLPPCLLLYLFEPLFPVYTPLCVLCGWRNLFMLPSLVRIAWIACVEQYFAVPDETVLVRSARYVSGSGCTFYCVVARRNFIWVIQYEWFWSNEWRTMNRHLRLYRKNRKNSSVRLTQRFAEPDNLLGSLKEIKWSKVTGINGTWCIISLRWIVVWTFTSFFFVTFYRRIQTIFVIYEDQKSGWIIMDWEGPGNFRTMWGCSYKGSYWKSPVGQGCT